MTTVATRAKCFFRTWPRRFILGVGLVAFTKVVVVAGPDVIFNGHKRKVPLRTLHRACLRMFGYRPCKLIGKEVLTEGSENPIIGLKFETDPDTLRKVDPGVAGVISLTNGNTYRNYSPEVIDDKTFSLAVKVYKGGRMTQYLNTVVDVGDELWWTPRHGGLSRASTGDHVGLIAMGNGITGAFPIIQRELASRPSSKVNFLYVNRTEKDEIWIQRLAELAAAHPDRFTYTRHLTRQPPQDDDAEQRISHDRLTPDTLTKYFKTWDPKDSKFHVVGTQQHKWSIWRALRQTTPGASDLIVKKCF